MSIPGTVSKHFANNRIRWSRAILLLTLILAIFSDSPRYLSHFGLHILAIAGYVMLVAAALWRVWCLLFIGGTKDRQLAVQGPFSVVRNPLYIGNFLGIVGFGLALGLPLLAAGLAVLFWMLYPAVVAQEERRLLEIFGESYAQYHDRVPRWAPSWSLYEAPQTIEVPVEKVRQGILDRMWYLWAFAFAEMLGILRENHLVPAHF